MHTNICPYSNFFNVYLQMKTNKKNKAYNTQATKVWTTAIAETSVLQHFPEKYRETIFKEIVNNKRKADTENDITSKYGKILKVDHSEHEIKTVIAELLNLQRKK